MRKKIIGVIAVIAIAAVAAFNMGFSENNLSEISLANIEALAQTESGAKCPNGCKDIGWGTSKILECDCNYDHFSCCNNWGC